MSTRWLWVALTVSLLVNLALLAGAGSFWWRWQDWRDPEQRLTRAAEALDLNQAETQRLAALHDKLGEARRSWRGDRETRNAQFADLLAAPEFDEAAVLAAMEQRLAARQDGFLEMGREIHGFLHALPTDKRDKAIAGIRERGLMRSLLGLPERRWRDDRRSN